MKKKIFSLLVIVSICSCKKNDDTTTTTPVDPIQQEKNILTDFANILAIPNYADINNKAIVLQTAIDSLIANSTDNNLSISRTSWRNCRQAWESCEGFLFGPVEDFNYDPSIDDWPVNKVDLDSLLNSSNPFSQNDIDALPTTLKGFHAIEYIIFGTGGTMTAAQLTQREKDYLNAITINLNKITQALATSWTPPNNFASQLINAGIGSQAYATRKDAFLAIIASMSGICDEVANGKLQEPFVAMDSTLQESQFSHNSLTDFKNNITGVRNAYLCKYTADGTGLNDFVASKNISLDNAIQAKINAAISSFDLLNPDYGYDIYNEPSQIRQVQTAIRDLQSTIDGDLTSFIQTNVQ